jgi:DNA polymerase-1
MPRLVVLDALGLIYRAHYALIGRPLSVVAARAGAAGRVRFRDLAISTLKGPAVAAAEGGAIEILDAGGAVLESHEVPHGAFVQVADGAPVDRGRVLLTRNTSAIHGFANTVLKLRREHAPDRWALAWDGPGPTHRHEAFSGYKAQRKPMPDDLRAQIAPIEELAACLGLPVIEQPGMEADDVMATLARRGREAGYEVVLVTGDKDMLQIVDDRVTVLLPPVRGDEYVTLDPAAVRAKWQVGPEQIRDVLALMGDTVDNIPGVPGVGEKTAVELIVRFGSLEQLYQRLAEVTRPALKKRLAEHRDLAFLSRELATVRGDLDLGLGLDDLPVAPLRRDELTAFARRWELKRLEAIARELGVAGEQAGARVVARAVGRSGTSAEGRGTGVGLAPPPAPGPAPPPAKTAPAPGPAPPPAEIAPAPAPSPEIAPAAAPAFTPAPPLPPMLPPSEPAAGTQGTLDLWGTEGELADGEAARLLIARIHAVRARAIHGLALLPLAGPGEPRVAPLVGLALAARDGTTCYVPLAHERGPRLAREQVVEWLGPALADPSVPKVGTNLKRDAHLLHGLGIPLRGLDFDVHIGSFICDPSRGHGLADLARDVLGVELPGLDVPASARREGAAALPVETADAAWSARVATVFPLADQLRAQIEAHDQHALYETIEHPLIRVLLAMERAGVAVDVPQLEAMAQRAGEEIERLRAELLQVAGADVNLESGAQVAKVLFETLQLKPGGRTPSGALSTRSDVLEELAAMHPFPARLLEYRALTKLKSTYLDALPRAVDPRDGRVHTSYGQAGASTGRLSSSNPNLQNIPMRTEQGRAIRKAFVAPPGHLLVGADYSQIELRVMAHLSGDPQLIEAFTTGQDVHESTARRIFGIAPGQPLDPALRSRAKIVNFGVMYGMGARSLSQQMGIPLAEAQSFIAGYFRVFARVREYIDASIQEARGRGFVQTLFGRRVYLPQLTGGQGGLRAAAERIAINAPIQGSAADLMKLAMIRVHRVLKQHRASARLLLQVHDELLLEARTEEVDTVSELVRSEMEGCFAMRVPLTVSLGRGATWFDVH